MKKKCTNSSCRRAFSLSPEAILVRCPHCGKEYPRLRGKTTGYIRLCSAKNVTRLTRGCILYRRYVRRESVFTIREMLADVDQNPITMGPYPRPQLLQLLALWQELGYEARPV